MLADAWGVERYPVAESVRTPNMALIALPPIFQDNFPPEERECKKLMKRIHEKGVFPCFIPVSGKIWTRISVHAWNSMEDFYEVRDKVIEMMSEVPSIVEMDYLWWNIQIWKFVHLNLFSHSAYPSPPFLRHSTKIYSVRLRLEHDIAQFKVRRTNVK